MCQIMKTRLNWKISICLRIRYMIHYPAIIKKNVSSSLRQMRHITAKHFFVSCLEIENKIECSAIILIIGLSIFFSFFYYPIIHHTHVLRSFACAFTIFILPVVLAFKSTIQPHGAYTKCFILLH